MPTNYKILGQHAPNAATETTHYTVPASKSTVVKSINITNRSSTSDTYTISILSNVASATANKDYIAFNNTILGNSTVSIKAGYTIPTGGGIKITSTNGTCTFSSFGAEIQ